MHISEIELRNWKNFKAASAKLSRRVFLIGPNASGKSNLLDALRFLRDLARTGLSAAVGARGGVSAIRCLAARESPGIGVGVTLCGEDGADRWHYQIEFNQDPNRVPKVRKEVVRDLMSDSVVVERPDKADHEDEVLLTQTALEQIVANRRFREIADFFSSISYQHLVPQVVRDPKGFSSSQVENDPYGRDLLLRIWETDVRTRSARLKRIAGVLQQAVPQLKGLEVEMDGQGTPHLVGRYEHWRAHGAKQNEAQFSDGTLRLFGLMWAVFEGSGPLLLEEPELSLHPEIVRQLPQLLVQLQESIRRMKKRTYEARQILVSTHSEEMLQDLGIGAEEVLRIEPSPEGSILQTADAYDRDLLSQGLSAADVLLPKSSPLRGQLVLAF